VQGAALPVGSIVSPGEEIMLIVQKRAAPTIEARIPATVVGRFEIGQPAVLTASRFGNASVSEIKGKVEDISADAATDNLSGETYYTARVVVPPDEAARLAPEELKPGTRVQVSVASPDSRIITGLVTPIVHFAKPIREGLARAF
jgi:HlyD family secretion protein